VSFFHVTPLRESKLPFKNSNQVFGQNTNCYHLSNFLKCDSCSSSIVLEVEIAHRLVVVAADAVLEGLGIEV